MYFNSIWRKKQVWSSAIFSPDMAGRSGVISSGYIFASTILGLGLMSVSSVQGPLDDKTAGKPGTRQAKISTCSSAQFVWSAWSHNRNSLIPSHLILIEFPVCKSFFKVEPRSLKQLIRNRVYKQIFKTYKGILNTYIYFILFLFMCVCVCTCLHDALEMRRGPWILRC